MKKKTLIISIVTILTGGLFAGAGCRHHSMHCSAEKKAEWVTKKISRELDLTDEQKLKLNQIKDEFLAKKNELHGNRKEMLDAFLLQVNSSQIDEEKLNSLIAEKETKMIEMRKYLVSKFAEFHAVLTPEQRGKLAAKVSEFHEKCN